MGWIMIDWKINAILFSFFLVKESNSFLSYTLLWIHYNGAVRTFEFAEKLVFLFLYLYLNRTTISEPIIGNPNNLIWPDPTNIFEEGKDLLMRIFLILGLQPKISN